MNHLEETLNIDTPENVTFGYEIAGIGSRFLAALIDTVIIFVSQVMIYILIILIVSEAGSLSNNLESLTSSFSAWMIAVVGLISFLFLWGYYIYFEMRWNGSSPGKKVLGLRVIRIDGTPITITESFIRNLVRIVDFLPSFYGVGVIAIFINRQTRRLGDLAAGTVVVREPDQRAQIKSLKAAEKALSKLAASPQVKDSIEAGDSPAETPATTLPVDLLNYQDAQMIESYFQRRKELTNRGALAKQLVDTMWAKMKLTDPPPPGGPPAEEALAKILTEYRQLHMP
jgi:uncharacterized RDD family membrane protein YckC